MSDNIVSIEEHQPTVTAIDPITQNVHIFPMSLLRDIASGKYDIIDLGEQEEATRALIDLLIVCLEEV